MFRNILCSLSAILVVFGLGIPGAAIAVDSRGPYVESAQSQRVADIDFYYGLMPVQIMNQASSPGIERAMPGAGVPSRRSEYHLVVALFDQNGKRITEARVAAMVGEVGTVGVRKVLEPIQIGEVTTFGNYFVLREGGTYRIAIEVRRTGRQEKVEAVFDYRLQ